MNRNLARILALLAFAGIASLVPAADEPAKELEGYVLEQADGTFFNLLVENNNLTVYIYDAAKKEKQPMPFNRARIKYQPPSGERQNVFMTRSEDGLSLRSGHIVKRPIAYNFWLYLFKEGSDDTAMTVTGRLVQPMPGDGASMSLNDLLEAGKNPNG